MVARLYGAFVRDTVRKAAQLMFRLTLFYSVALLRQALNVLIIHAL